MSGGRGVLPWTVGFFEKGCDFAAIPLIFPNPNIHVWYIYLHLPYFTIKNNQM